MQTVVVQKETDVSSTIYLMWFSLQLRQVEKSVTSYIMNQLILWYLQL